MLPPFLDGFRRRIIRTRGRTRGSLRHRIAQRIGSSGLDPLVGHARQAVVLDEFARDGALRVGEDLGGRPLLHDAARVDDRDAVADLLRHGERMGDDDHRHAEAGVDLLEELEDRDRRARVERARGLVAQHDLGVVGQRAGDGDALLLAAGELAGIAVGLVGELDHLEQLAGALLALALGRAAQLQRERDVAQHGALLEQAEVLEDHADGGAQLEQLLAGEVGDIAPVDEDLARRGALEQVDAAHERGLARARGTDDAEDVAVVDGQVDVVERMVRGIRRCVIRFAQVLNLYHGASQMFLVPSQNMRRRRGVRHPRRNYARAPAFTPEDPGLGMPMLCPS